MPQCAVLVAAVVAATTAASTYGAGYSPFKFGQEGAESAPGMDLWFKDAKLGMFSKSSNLLPVTS